MDSEVIDVQEKFRAAAQISAIENKEGPCPRLLGFLSNSAKSRFNSQVKDLSRTLTFTEDALPSSSSCVTRYSSAKHRFWELFQPGNVRLEMQQARKDCLGGGGGRYSIRCSGIKHLPCHMEDSTSARSARVSFSLPSLQPLVCRKKELAFNMEYISEYQSLDKLYPFSKMKNYVKDLEAGARPVHNGRGSIILLDNNTKYKKVLQKSYPQSPENYFMAEGKGREVWEGARSRRWLDFPQPVKTSEQVIWRDSSTQDSHSETCMVSQETIPSTDKSSEGQEFFDIMRKWASQRSLHVQLKDVKPAPELLKDMYSLFNNVRMLAVTSVAVLAEDQATTRRTHRKPHKRSHWSGQDKTLRENKVTEELVHGLEGLLEDSVVRVRVPSAITLSAINRHVSKAKSVLISALKEGTHLKERWAAVQCLVCAGQHSATIISELLHHLVDFHHPTHQARAEELLVKISYKADLVNSMIADLLNHSGWRERLAACKVLSKVHTDINKDMRCKLLLCAWEDWSPAVRQTATQALGHTAHGKLIHDEIASRLIHGSEMVRLDAIRKLHSLKFMTSKLLPGYMACLKDEHISIQAEAIAVAGTIILQHPGVLRAIKQLLQDSSCSTIKSCALRALAQIGKCDKQLLEQLRWMVRFEKVPSVRAEACKTIAKLGLDEERVLKSLRDLVTVDDDPAVVSEARRALVELGQSESVCDDMLQSICSRVQALGTKEAITNTVRAAETTRTTNYVVASRPARQLSGRDYLNHKCRSTIKSSLFRVMCVLVHTL